MHTYTDHRKHKLTSPVQSHSPLAWVSLTAMLVCAVPVHAASVSDSDQSDHQLNGTSYLIVSHDNDGTNGQNHSRDLFDKSKHEFGETEHGLTEKEWGGHDSLNSLRGKNDDDGGVHDTIPHEGSHDGFDFDRHEFENHEHHDSWDKGNRCDPPAVVPLPAAAWLFGSGLLGLIGVARHKKA